MDTTFILENACSASIGLINMPYAAGFFTITSPFGTPIKIANLAGTPDYTVQTDLYTYPITPPYTPSDGTVQAGAYEVIVYNDANHSQSTTYQYTLSPADKKLATITIAYTQDCNANTATFNYTGDIPIDATGVTYLWTISDPNNATTTETTSQITIDPTINGTYTVILAITYTVVIGTGGGGETYLTRTTTASASYTKTCGNAQSLLCDTMYCCIKASLYKFIGESTWGNGADLLAKLAAGFLMQLAITCNKQQDAQIILDELNTKYDCHACGDCSGCK
jgi:hypothetical protein